MCVNNFLLENNRYSLLFTGLEQGKSSWKVVMGWIFPQNSLLFASKFLSENQERLARKYTTRWNGAGVVTLEDQVK